MKGKVILRYPVILFQCAILNQLFKQPVIRKCRIILLSFFRWIVKNFPLRTIENIACPVTPLQNSSAVGCAMTSGRLTSTFSIVSPCICGSTTLLTVSISGNSGIIITSTLRSGGCRTCVPRTHCALSC